MCEWEGAPMVDSRMSNAEKRRVRMAHARSLGTHTKEDWLKMLELYDYKCVRCGEDGICKDHIKPIYQGGSDGVENLQPLCQRCNCGKGRESVDFRGEEWKYLFPDRFFPGVRLNA